MNEQYPGWEVNMVVGSKVRIVPHLMDWPYHYGIIIDKDKTSFSIVSSDCKLTPSAAKAIQSGSGSGRGHWVLKHGCYKADKIEVALYF